MATEKKVIYLPEGRIINQSLMTRDAFVNPDRPNDKPGAPMYKIELAFDPDQVLGKEGGPRVLEDELWDIFAEKWGDTDANSNAFFDRVSVALPLIDGDRLARKREEKKKPGDAYKGKIILRANTKYNANGDDADGGAYVVDEQNELLRPSGAAEKLWNGVYAQAAVTADTYTQEVGGQDIRGITLYLKGVQITRPGERLSSGDNSNLFKPVGRTEGSTEGSTRRRRG